MDAERIGFVQRVTAVRDGEPDYWPLSAEHRAVPDTEGGRSWIDRRPGYRTPIYGMQNPPAERPEPAASKPIDEIAWGWRYTDEGGTSWQRPARMNDTTRLRGHGPDSRQILETAALAVAGRQAGTWYGSIRWGWRSDAATGPQLDAPAVSGIGVPSETFVDAAAAWNRQPPRAVGANLPLPLPAGSARSRPPADMSLPELRARLRAIEAEREAARSENPPTRDTATLDFEERALRREYDRRMGDRPPGDLIPPPTTPITGG